MRARESRSDREDWMRRGDAPLMPPTDLGAGASKEVAGAMNVILADVFALYLKTKNFHAHLSGPHFRDYHLLLDEQADQLSSMTDTIAERIRKAGGSTLRSIGHIAQIQRVKDNDATASFIESWIDETERRTWFLFESTRHVD